jgi:6-phosphogluconolactonase
MNDRTFVVVGSLTRDAPYFQGARGKGITVFVFDEQTGQLTRLAEKGGVDNPTYLSVHEGNRCVYANSEVFGWNENRGSAYRLDPHDGRLRYLNKQSALGSIPAHNSLDGTGRCARGQLPVMPNRKTVTGSGGRDAIGRTAGWSPVAVIPIRAAVPRPTGKAIAPIAPSRVQTTVTFSSLISGPTSLSSIVSTRRPARFRRLRRH